MFDFTVKWIDNVHSLYVSLVWNGILVTQIHALNELCHVIICFGMNKLTLQIICINGISILATQNYLCSMEKPKPADNLSPDVYHSWQLLATNKKNNTKLR